MKTKKFSGKMCRGLVVSAVLAAAATALALNPVYVSPTGSDTTGNGTAGNPVATIQKGITLCDVSGTVNVADGTYLGEVNVNKTVNLHGAGYATTIIQGPKGTGTGNTVTLGANNIVFEGFTVTREGNNPTDWATNKQSQGVIVSQSKTGITIQDCKLTGNRNALYMNNTQNHIVRRNIIDNNRTGVQFVNNVSGNVFTENEITNNWTMGVLFNFDSATLKTTGITIHGNKIAGNWYGDVVCRMTFSTAIFDLAGNWFGSNSAPTVSTAASTEPAYVDQIPVAFGGTAAAPGGMPNILGATSGLIAYNAWLDSATDTNSAAVGFQSDFALLHVSAASPLAAGATGRIQQAIGLCANGGTVSVASGTYPENGATNTGLLINKSITLVGPNAGKAGDDASRVAAAAIVPAIVLNASDSPREWSENPVVHITASDVVVDGFTVSGDNPSLTGYPYAGMNVCADLGILSEANNVHLVNNVVEKFTYIGVHSAGSQVSPHYTGMEFKHNLVQSVHDLNQLGYGFGLYCQATAADVSQNKFANTRTAIQIQPYDIAGTPMVVSGNVISAWRQGIYYNYAENGATAWTITGNQVSACTPPAPGPSGPVVWEGIRAETMRATSNGGLITGNTIDGAVALSDATHVWGGFAHAVWGMRYSGNASLSTQLFFTNNTVSNVQFGFVHDAPVDTTLTGNDITATQDVVRLQRYYGSTGTPQATGGTGNVDATGGNTFNGVASSGASLAQLFAIEDRITHKLDDSSLGFVRVKAGNVYVTPSSASVNRGVMVASASDTVHVQDGLYLDNVTVNKHVTIEGQSQAGVTVAPTGEDANANSSYAAPLQIGFLVASDNVTIRNLTIDGFANTSLTPGKRNFRSGIMTDFGTGDYNNLVVENVTARHIYRRGIYPVANTTAHTSGHQVINCSVDDVWSPDASSSFGIIAWDADTLMQGNTVTNSACGLASNMSSYSVAPVIVAHGNIVAGCDYGADFSGCAQGSSIGGPNSGDGNAFATTGDTGGQAITVQWTAGQVNVEGNTISVGGNETALLVYRAEQPTSNVIVRSNVITATNSYSTTSSEGVGVLLTDDSRLFGESSDGASYASLTSNTITGFATGVSVANLGVQPAPGMPVVATIGGTATDSNVIGGSTTGTGVLVTGALAQAQLDRNIIKGNGGAGIRYSLGGSLIARYNKIATNGTGVLVDSGSDLSGVDMQFNRITGNTAGATNNSTLGSLNALHSWWGSVSGPRNATTNPTGTGNPVSANVLYNPWYGQGNLLDDSDGDGVVNADEDVNLNGVVDPGETNFAAGAAGRDSDSDGFEDGVELLSGTDPLNAASHPAANAPRLTTSTDSDNDGFKDYYELEHGTDPGDPLSKPTLGDANGDTFVTPGDATILRRISLGTLQLSNYKANNLDLNRDGAIGPGDATILRRYSLGTITVLPTN